MDSFEQQFNIPSYLYFFFFFQVVYIAPMKALVRERVEDWRVRLEQKLNKRVVELTGDVSPDIRAIQVYLRLFLQVKVLEKFSLLHLICYKLAKLRCW